MDHEHIYSLLHYLGSDPPMHQSLNKTQHDHQHLRVLTFFLAGREDTVNVRYIAAKNIMIHL